MNWSRESGNLTLGGGYGDSTVLYMKFDANCTGQTGACVKDWSGHGNNGTLSGSTNWTSSGKFAGAYVMNASGDYINCSNDSSLNVNDGIAIEGWVNLRNATQGNIANKHYSYALSTNIHGWPQFTVWVSGTAHTVMHNTSLPTGEWHHLTGSYDGSSLRIYLDGVLKETSVETFSGSIDTNSTDLIIGGGEGTCSDSENMSYVDKLGGFCIDKYEASLWNADGSYNYTSTDTSWDATDTDAALADGAYAGSSLGKYPWVYIDQTEARTACVNAGKYLCTSEQWLAAANVNGSIYDLPTGAATATNIPSGASDADACVTHSNAEAQNKGPNNGDADGTGNHSRCVSAEGVYDMTGNVWEWTNETVDVTNPGGGAGWYYINVTDMSWSSSSSADDGTYGLDGTYFPATTAGRAVQRGGSWYSGAAAGPFCAYLNTAPSGTSYYFGFRCCSAPD